MLCQNVPKVIAADFPDPEAELPCAFVAVFGSNAHSTNQPFRGLACAGESTKQHARLYGEQTLLGPLAIAADAGIETLTQFFMREPLNALPVTDQDGSYLGVALHPTPSEQHARCVQCAHNPTRRTLHMNHPPSHQSHPSHPIHAHHEHHKHEHRPGHEHHAPSQDLLLEQISQYRDELAQARHEMAAFCYSISHDLRAPLRAIDGYARILAEDYSGSMDPAARGYLDRIVKASGRMGNLMDDLLMLSRVSRSEMRPQSLNLSQLSSDIIDRLMKSDPNRRRVHVHIEPGLQVLADGKLIRECLEQLLDNAWKYTSKTRQAQIDIGRFEDKSGPLPHQGFYVQDNGAGFDMQYAEKLFTPFQRLHTAPDFDGNGIGLAIVQRIIHRHSGHLSIKGEPGRGTRLRFSLWDTACPDVPSA